IVNPAGVGREPLVAGDLRPPEDLRTEKSPFPIALNSELDGPAVPRPEGPVGGDRGVAGSRSDGLLSAVQAVINGMAHPLGETVEERDLAGGAFTRTFPAVKGGQYRGQAVHPGRDGGDRDPYLGRSVGGAGPGT